MGVNKEHDLAPHTRLMRFKHQELVEATNNFSEPLGEGASGKVYKGWVRGKRGVGNTGERVAVAVKVLKGGSGGETQIRAGDQQGEKQFRTEVSTLGKIHHINLVSLLGYSCASGRAGERRLLVYEYMGKGSLDQFLSAAQYMQQPLPWATRYSIALGTARGIAYLHHECSPHILHCDIKPQNVLLDEDFNPKVADFGFARRFHHKDSHLTMSGMHGTRGYMAPEWLESNEITSKVDVYSFGMVLLELVRGINTTDDSMPLLEWAIKCISSPAGELILSPQAGHSNDNINVHEPSRVAGEPCSQEENKHEAVEQQLQVLKVGLWCVQHMPSMRPSMFRVVQLLEGAIALEDPPNPTPDVTIINLPSHQPRSSSYVHFYSVVSPR